MPKRSLFTPVLAAILSLFTPPFFPAEPPAQIKIVIDTDHQKIGIEGNNYSYQRIYKYRPRSNEILKFVNVPRGGGGDGGNSVTFSPSGSTFVLTAYSVGMSLEITKSTVLDQNLNPLPIDIDYCFGLDDSALLGAPDIARYPGQRMSSAGPLALFDTSTSKALWRRWDISTERQNYIATLWPDSVVVRFPNFKNAVKVLDRQTGKTKFADPPESLTIGGKTFNPWPTPKYADPDINKFAYNNIEPLYDQSSKMAILWKSPTRKIAISNLFNNKEDRGLHFSRLRPSPESKSIKLPSWVTPYNIFVNHSPDSPLYAVNCFADFGHPPTDCFTILVKDGIPIQTFTDTDFLKFEDKAVYLLKTKNNSQYLHKLNPSTLKPIWISKALGPTAEVIFNSKYAFVRIRKQNQSGRLLAINLESGKTQWEIN